MTLRAAAIVYISALFDCVGLILRQTFTYSRRTCRGMGQTRAFEFLPFPLQLASVLQAASLWAEYPLL